jgi:hypothetical protein
MDRRNPRVKCTYRKTQCDFSELAGCMQLGESDSLQDENAFGYV